MSQPHDPLSAFHLGDISVSDLNVDTLSGELELPPIRRCAGMMERRVSFFLSCKGCGHMRQGRQIALGDPSVAT